MAATQPRLFDGDPTPLTELPAGRRTRAEINRRQRERHAERMAADPEYAERKRARARRSRDRLRRDADWQQRRRAYASARWHRETADPERRAEINRRQRERHAERMATDPEYAERQRAKHRARHQRRWADPAQREAAQARSRAYLAEKMADPEYAERERERQRQRHAEQMADPERRAEINRRKRARHAERMAADPEYAERVRERARERARQHGRRGAKRHGDALAARDHGWWCRYCAVSLTSDTADVDHVWPVSRADEPGAPADIDALSNLVLACAACNRAKSARLLSEWLTGDTLAAATAHAERTLSTDARRYKPRGRPRLTDSQPTAERAHTAAAVAD